MKGRVSCSDIMPPYFMQDKTWYYWDEDRSRYYLTDGAPPEAKKSYEDFYREPFIEFTNDSRAICR